MAKAWIESTRRSAPVETDERTKILGQLEPQRQAYCRHKMVRCSSHPIGSGHSSFLSITC